MVTVPALWRIAFTVPEAVAPLFADMISDAAEVAAVSSFELEEGGAWLIEATAVEAPDTSRLATRLALLAASLGVAEPVLTVEPLPATDWLAQSYHGFPPLRAGRFFLYGSHIQTPPPPGCYPLRIDAATAFGTGEHETTRGCLLVLDRLCRGRRPSHALDMGCGSGILALAMARAWRVPVLAVDIDPESVRVARFNARRNGLAPWVRVTGGNGYANPEVRAGRPYPLIAANILARPLARMAPALARHLEPGGTAVLSGLLARQERLVVAAHRAQGLRLVSRLRRGDWMTLVIRR